MRGLIFRIVLFNSCILDYNDIEASDNFFLDFIQNLRKITGNPNFGLIELNACHNSYTAVNGIFTLTSSAPSKLYQRFSVQTLRTSVLSAIKMFDRARELDESLIILQKVKCMETK